MSAPKKKPAKVLGNYAVGYSRPPVQHRFKPGQSGNPRGTRKPKHSPYEERLKGIVAHEFYRPVTVRDGERSERLPIIQATIRSAALQAAKGNVRAQKLVSDLLRWVEEGRLASRLEGIENACEYKEGWIDELWRRKQLGLVGPEPVPHPDHVQIDWNKLDVTITGPVTPEQKDLFDKLYVIKLAHREELAFLEADLLKTPDDPYLISQVEQQRALLERFDKFVKDEWYTGGKLPKLEQAITAIPLKS
jgi:Family of unknown function (DUF5681)